LYRSSNRSWVHSYLCRWPSNSRPTWPDDGDDDWWVRLISRRFHIVLSTDESDDPQSGCWDLWYPIWDSSSYDTPGLSTWVPETQAPADARHKCPRREIRPRDTYNPSIIRRILRRRWCVFLISDTVVYIFILFERQYFIFFIYSLKFSFSFLRFDINFLQNFQIIKHTILLKSSNK
jgi:hypothetical protein